MPREDRRDRSDAGGRGGHRGRQCLVSGAAEGAADGATEGEGAEVKAAAVGDNDVDATNAETSAGHGGGTPSGLGSKELITYRRMCEYQRDSRN